MQNATFKTSLPQLVKSLCGRIWLKRTVTLAAANTVTRCFLSWSHRSWFPAWYHHRQGGQEKILLLLPLFPLFPFLCRRITHLSFTAVCSRTCVHAYVEQNANCPALHNDCSMWLPEWLLPSRGVGGKAGFSLLRPESVSSELSSGWLLEHKHLMQTWKMKPSDPASVIAISRLARTWRFTIQFCLDSSISRIISIFFFYS